MLKLKKLNENFSSIDPQGQESKAHRLWKWLMDNGSKIEDPTRFKTFAQLQREVKKRLNIK